jgi:hypothetical protein
MWHDGTITVLLMMQVIPNIAAAAFRCCDLRQWSKEKMAYFVTQTTSKIQSNLNDFGTGQHSVCCKVVTLGSKSKM